MKTIALLLLAGTLGCGNVDEADTAAAPIASCETVKVLPDGTACMACDGAAFARLTAGPDGWCDFDGTSCACHGHGAGDQCAQLVADFDACR
jgi:hypothetical protein